MESERTFLAIAVDSFVLGKFAACRSVLEGVPEDIWRKSTVTRWLVENNLIVCSFKEQLLAGDIVNIAEMMDRLQTISQVIQGLPPSLKCLPIELTVSFNMSALLLQQMNTREPVQSSSIQACVDQIQEIIKSNSKRVFSAMGIVKPRPASLEKLLSTMASIAHFVPTDIVLLMSLQCCLLGLCHMITRRHQEAVDILNMTLKMHSSRVQDDTKYPVSSLALIMSLHTSNFAVDINCLKGKNSSSLDVGSLARFLLVICLSQTGQWAASLHHISTLQPNLPESLNSIQKFIQGYCLYQKGSFQSALEPLTSLTASPECDSKLKAKTLNLIGCCLATLNKPYTAIQKFQEALKIDFAYLCPLYNISLVYRHLELQDAEIEALDLLIGVLKERHGSTADPAGSNDGILGALPSLAPNQQYGGFGIDECSLSIVFLMHTLAQRCWEIGRHDDAAQRYKDLLRDVEDDLTLLAHQSPFSHLEVSTGVPSMQTICLEAALSLYHAKDFQQSLSIAEKIITKTVPRLRKKSNQVDLSFNSRDDDEHFLRPNGHTDALPGVSYHGNSSGDQEPDIFEAVPSCSRGRLGQSTGNVNMDLKHNLEPGINFRLSCLWTKTFCWSNPAGGKGNFGETDQRLLIANTLLLKSNCLIKKNSFHHALDVTNYLLEYLSMTEAESDEAGSSTREVKLDMMEDGEDETPQNKRRKIDHTPDSENITTSHEDAKDKELTNQQPIRASLLEIKAKTYNNKAMILIGQKKNSEALHMLILSIQCKPDDIDALYNYALLLTKMSRKEEASQTMKKLLVLEASLKTSPLSQYLSK